MVRGRPGIGDYTGKERYAERYAERYSAGMTVPNPRRRNVGQFDERLLALIDEQAAILGQSRRTYMERLLWKHLEELGIPATREDPETPTRKTKRR